MEEINSISLTKGYFIHRPIATKKKKSGDATNVSSKEAVESPVWSEIKTKIEKIVEQAYLETFNGVVEFIKKCSLLSHNQDNEVPAAILVMGVNMSDHSNLFRLLEQELHSNEIYGTVILESKKCNNMTNTLQVILNEINSKYEEVLAPTDRSFKKQDFTFSKFLECYERICETKSSPTKKKDIVKATKRKSFSKVIVLLIQDVESFNQEVLQELILLSKIYLDRLPIVLVFGMVSAMVTLHSLLPQKALCCLGVETFYSVPATDYLTRVIEEVMVSPDQPFKLGHRVFRLVVDTVLYHDFSVTNLTYLLKFSVLMHLYNKSTATLCCKEDEIEDAVQRLSHKDLQILKDLPSLKMYTENNPQFVSCMKSPVIFKESVIGFLKKLFEYHRMTLIRLKLLHCFVKDLPGYPLGKQLRELYSSSLEKEICLTPAFAEAQKLLQMQSQQSLLSKLEACLVVLNDVTEENLQVEGIRTIIKDGIDKISKLTACDFDKNAVDPLSLSSDKITSRFQLQEKIQMSIKLKRSNFETARNEIIENILLIFKNIVPPSSLPLYEVFYFDDVSFVKRHLMAVPRVASCYSLANPSYHLKCSCCKIISTEEIKPTMPDICILYKLHLESGKLINLYDWLESFKTIKKSSTLDARKAKTKKPKEKSVDDDDLNIRFLQAVSELQLLGYIKPTKRKTDHVARLTFGSF